MERKGLMPHTGGILGGRHPVSRDWGLPDFPCKRSSCVCNNQNGKCFVPSKAVIGEDGRCEGYQPRNTLKADGEKPE